MGLDNECLYYHSVDILWLRNRFKTRKTLSKFGLRQRNTLDNNLLKRDHRNTSRLTIYTTLKYPIRYNYLLRAQKWGSWMLNTSSIWFTCGTKQNKNTIQPWFLLTLYFPHKGTNWSIKTLRQPPFNLEGGRREWAIFCFIITAGNKIFCFIFLFWFQDALSFFSSTFPAQEFLLVTAHREN